ncbi:DUF3862 domain-containing protein [Clostridium oceanicum]|uniref:DUF3862 domain-containing protein n=1 Tax=Clostridium oceanicum TaxID=1543 RepID=A0ABP3UIV8_9CLOT
MSQKLNKPLYKKFWFWIIIFLIIGGIVGGMRNTNKESSKTSTKNSNIEVKKDTRKITYEKFSEVKIGTTYDDIKKILGKGKEATSSEISGIKTIVYSWRNADGSNVDVTVQNGKVVGKGQAGLSLKSSNVNMDKYNKIKTGMNYNSVKQILGQGQLISTSSMQGISTSIYSWINSDGSNITVTFQNGKFASKTQFELK